MEDIKQQEGPDSDDSEYDSDDSHGSAHTKGGRKTKKPGSKGRKGRGQDKSEGKVRIIEKMWDTTKYISLKTCLCAYS